MANIFYFVTTLLESSLSIFGIRSALEQPRYTVMSQLDPAIEIRAYGPLVAVETRTKDDTDDAFSRLFRYIAGANAGHQTISMTAPVEQSGGSWSGTPGVPGGLTMRFFLPAKITGAPPMPQDPLVRIVTVPARDIAVIRFSGSLDRDSVDRHLKILRTALAEAGRSTRGGPFVLGYDPPFTIPALRRNEVALAVES